MVVLLIFWVLFAFDVADEVEAGMVVLLVFWVLFAFDVAGEAGS